VVAICGTCNVIFPCGMFSTSTLVLYLLSFFVDHVVVVVVVVVIIVIIVVVVVVVVVWPVVDYNESKGASNM
jgi:hypothetical protein